MDALRAAHAEKPAETSRKKMGTERGKLLRQNRLR